MKLYFVNGDRSGQSWHLEPPGICIGREEDNDIQLLLPGISRYHAKIEYDGSNWLVVDLGSTNGTKVNGNVIDNPVILKDGMILTMGEQVIRYTEEKSNDIKMDLPDREEGNIPPAAAKPGAAPAPQAPVILTPISGGQQKAEEKESSAAELSPGKEESRNPIQNLSGNIFGKKNSSSKDSSSNPAQAGSNPRKRIQNLLFLLLVVVMGCGVILIFTVLNTSSGKKEPVTRIVVNNPFILEYEKKLISADNIFRFYVRVEENSALFKLNDLRHNRFFTKGIGNVDETALKSLINEIKQTDFMKITSDNPGKPREGIDDYRSLTIGYGSSFNRVITHNSYPKRSFEDIESALENFAAEFGLKTISLSPEQMEKEAHQSFLKAEELFSNYQARPENLRNAILRYQIAVDFLEQFEPKPQNWSTAKRRLAETEKLMNKLKKDAEFNINLYYKRRQFKEAVEECNKLLLILDPEDKNYQKIRNLKIVLEKRIDPRKKSR